MFLIAFSKSFSCIYLRLFRTAAHNWLSAEFLHTKYLNIFSLDHKGLRVVEVHMNLVLDRVGIAESTYEFKGAWNVVWDLKCEVEFKLTGRYFLSSKLKESFIKFKQ